MHDLTAIQGDEPVGHRPYQTLPEAKRKGKQATESPGRPVCRGAREPFITGRRVRMNAKEYRVLDTELALLCYPPLLTQRIKSPALVSGLLYK